MSNTFIIAEAGVNHNGSIEIAKEMIDIAKDCNVDAIKFQTFKTEKVISKHAKKADYQINNTGENESQYEMVKKLEFNENQFEDLFKYCKKADVTFISSPFDLYSIDLLDSLGVNILKIPSGEITNLPYLRKIGSLKNRVFLSTGMADLGEIEDALSILISSGTSLEDITLLHCTTDYPTPFIDVNLNAMLTLKAAFHTPVGYSDHTIGIEIPIAAAALGATVIEKHFTLDKSMKGPDHKASLEPEELKNMVSAIRNVTTAMGNGIKRPTESEFENRKIVRKSLVASKTISIGEILSLDNVSIKRPGTGINPMLLDSVLGKASNRRYEVDDLIEV